MNKRDIGQEILDGIEAIYPDQVRAWSKAVSVKPSSSTAKK